MWARRFKTSAFPAAAIDDYNDVCKEFEFPDACFLMKRNKKKEEEDKEEGENNAQNEKEKKEDGSETRDHDEKNN